MILGTGIDLLEIERLKRASSNEHFLRRVFTENERSYIEARGDRAETLAGIFCAKEAVAKALGTGFSGFGLLDIEILHDALGAPHATLFGGASERMLLCGGSTVHVSITHDRQTAAAFAVLEGSGAC